MARAKSEYDRDRPTTETMQRMSIRPYASGEIKERCRARKRLLAELRGHLSKLHPSPSQRAVKAADLSSP